MQHFVITATESSFFWTPEKIHIYRDDQFIRFSLGPDTAWGAVPISFHADWPGGPASPDVANTLVANGNTPLQDGVSTQQYHFTFSVVHIPTQSFYTHDPEVDNEPRP